MSSNPFDPSIGQGLGRDFLKGQKTRQELENLGLLATTSIVTGVSGDLVQVRDVRSVVANTQWIARAAGPDVVIGDLGVVILTQGGASIFIKTGGDAVTYAGSGGDLGVSPNVARSDHLHDARYIQLSPSHSPSSFWGANRLLSLVSDYNLGALTGITLTANRVYYVPVYCGFSRSGDALVFEVTTFVAGSVQLAIYSCSNSFLPNSRLIATAQTVIGSVGVKTLTITSTALESGTWYWVAICATSAMAVRGSNTQANIPALRSGMDPDNMRRYLICFEDISSGWTNIPTTASPSSGPLDTYLHLSIRGA